jgi:hypothetical protein
MYLRRLQLMNGRCYPFPGRVKNSFIAVDGDAHGSMIEVYPETITLQPGDGDAPVQQLHDKQPNYCLPSVAISAD